MCAIIIISERMKQGDWSCINHKSNYHYNSIFMGFYSSNCFYRAFHPCIRVVINSPLITRCFPTVYDDFFAYCSLSAFIVLTISKIYLITAYLIKIIYNKRAKYCVSILLHVLHSSELQMQNLSVNNRFHLHFITRSRR